MLQSGHALVLSVRVLDLKQITSHFDFALTLAASFFLAERDSISTLEAFIVEADPKGIVRKTTEALLLLRAALISFLKTAALF